MKEDVGVWLRSENGKVHNTVQRYTSAYGIHVQYNRLGIPVGKVWSDVHKSKTKTHTITYTGTCSTYIRVHYISHCKCTFDFALRQKYPQIKINFFKNSTFYILLSWTFSLSSINLFHRWTFLQTT